MAKHLFEQNQLSCVTLEQEAGLARGAIREIIVYPGGAVEVEVGKALNASQQGKVKDALSKRNLIRGMKPT